MEIPESTDMELVDSAAPAPVVPEPAAPSPEEPAKTEEVTPENPAPETPEASAEPQLFELPDGRKVDAATLEREWKENFLPEFTRKSQALAEVERGKTKDINPPKDGEPKWKSPEYVPENYAEVIEIATQEAERRREAKEKAEAERVEAIHTQVEAEVTSLKKIEPKLDENALFAHANKYGFSNLTAAYKNMVDMRKVVIETEQRTIKNVKAREKEEVSGGSSGATSPDDGYDPNEMSQFTGAVEFLNRLKGTKP